MKKVAPVAPEARFELPREELKPVTRRQVIIVAGIEGRFRIGRPAENKNCARRLEERVA